MLLNYVKKQILQKYGNIEIDEAVVPVKVSKVTMKDDQVICEEFCVEGRKSLWSVIGQNLLQRNKDLYICQNEADIDRMSIQECNFLMSINEFNEFDNDEEETLKRNKETSGRLA